MSKMNNSKNTAQAVQEVERSFLNQMLNSLFMHIVWGLTLGTISSLLTRKIGANYLCHVCNIEFSNIKTYEYHQKYVHENPSPNMKKILILDGGYAGIGVQHSFVYDTKGSMAKIGKNDGVALLLGHEFRRFIAWLIWKQYYLSTLPTNEKKIRVGLDWFVDLFFPRDITRLSSIFNKKRTSSTN